MTEHDDMKPLLMQHIHGIDHLKQIFDLWFELTYLRCVFNELCMQNQLTIDEKSILKAKEQAKVLMKEKFPTIDLEYTNPKETK